MKILVGLVAFAIVMLLAWYGGLELMERGFLQAYIAGMAIFAGVLSASYYAEYQERSK